MAGITRYAVDPHADGRDAVARRDRHFGPAGSWCSRSTSRATRSVKFDTELVREWFQAFTINAGVTLHVETLYGENSHHIAESCFKGLARALRAAVAIDPRAAGEVPSTKGQLGG